MKILLSPAKSISMEQNYPKTPHTEAHFLDQSEYLVNKLKKYSVKQLKNMYAVSQDIAETNHIRFAQWISPKVAGEQVKPALFAFTGEVYRGLDAVHLENPELDYLQENLRILSGLYGLLKPFDLMYPYRLEMGTSIHVTPKIKNLYLFWGDTLTELLNSEEKDCVINLASNEYIKAINPKKLNARFITPVFKELKNGTYKVLMTYAKHARGEMTKYAAQQGITHAEELKLFNRLGYQYMEQLSSENEWVFAR